MITNKLANWGLGGGSKSITRAYPFPSIYFFYTNNLKLAYREIAEIMIYLEELTTVKQMLKRQHMQQVSMTRFKS